MLLNQQFCVLIISCKKRLCIRLFFRLSNVLHETTAVVETATFNLVTAEKHHSKNHEWCTFGLSNDGQPVSADFSGKVSAAHGGVVNADVLLKQFEQHKAGDLVEVRYVYSDVSDTYYLLGVVGATAN